MGQKREEGFCGAGPIEQRRGILEMGNRHKRVGNDDEGSLFAVVTFLAMRIRVWVHVSC